MWIVALILKYKNELYSKFENGTKKDNVFEVIIDKEKHYLLIKDTNSKSDELTKQLVLVKTNDGSDSYFNEEKNQRFYLYSYAK